MVLKLNKYLKELGLDEDNCWLFNKNRVEDDLRYTPDEDGFVDAEFFSLDYSLSLYIYSQLCYFRENCMFGIPYGMEENKWAEILDKMILAFKLMIIEDDTYKRIDLTREERQLISKNRQKKINYGMRLFIKYYNDLWY